MEAAAYSQLTIAMTSLAVGVLKNSGSEKPRVAFRTKSAPLSAPLRDPLPYGVALLLLLYQRCLLIDTSYILPSESP
jgi:hypothetical protein